MMTEEERKAKEKAKQKAYYEANKAKRLAYGRAYYEANRAKRQAYNRARDSTPKRQSYNRARDSTPERKAYKRARAKARYATPEEKAKNPNHHLKRAYGITVRQRDEMIKAQGNRCLCCKTFFGLLKAHKPFVDHCHRTGKIRGILCCQCNVTIGHANDDPSVLRACARYLERHARSDRESEPSQATG